MRIIPLLLSLALAGCGGPVSTIDGSAPLRQEVACSLPTLPRASRQTVIIIDEASLLNAQDALSFRSRNPDVIDTVMAVASAETAVTNGALAPRERVSLYLAPADGSGLRLLFTGCAPSLSAEERQALEHNSGMIQDFASSGQEDRMDDYATEYQNFLLGGVQRAGRGAPAQALPAPRNFEGTPLIQSLRATPRISDPSLGITRIILIAPRTLRAIPRFASVAEARAAGFALARQLNLDFGQAELNVALAPGVYQRDFASAFFLGSGAQLASWSTRLPTGLSRAPTVVRRFAGEVRYGGGPLPVEIRIAHFGTGVLTNSWVLVRGERKSGTPLSGTILCAGERCRITGDDSGFAQVWSAEPGGDPEFDPNLPFVGLRNIEITLEGSRGTGRVFDSIVDQVGLWPDIPFRVAETR